MALPIATRPAIPLSDDVKSQIRQLLRNNVSNSVIASMYQCSENQVAGIWSQMVRKDKKAATKTAARKARPVQTSTPKKENTTTPEVTRARTDVFRRTPVRNVVRIDASNFDEVILVNGTNEIKVQISS